MKKLLASTAILVAFAGAASAQQSVLERVLSQVDNATNLASVNGTFANIAENIGGSSVVTVYLDGAGVAISQSDYDALVQAEIDGDLAAALVALGAAGYRTTEPVAADYDLTTVAGQTAYNADVALYEAYTDAVAAADVSGLATVSAAYTTDQLVVSGLEGINGSINNVINGLDTATMVASVGAVTAVEFLLPTVDLGNISSTVLGAVNTGEITLGVNQSVDQAKTTSTGALSSVIEQIGGSADTGALVLNIASNMTGVNGSINNTMTGVNGSVGTAATTVLGAVNTGTITSGINAAVAGIVGGTSQSGL
jgi:hypothetical protein